jgi:glutaredoxin-dependent peroxiredoxin
METQMRTPQVGDALPDFQCKLATQEGVTDFQWSKDRGTGPVVLAFFPLAFSGGCTKEVCDVRDNLPALADLGAKVFGFSTDSHFANRAFATEQKLPFGLLCDPNRDVVAKLWPRMEVAGIRNVAKRGVMVLDGSGRVAWSWVSDDPKVWVGFAAIEQALQDLE